MVQQPFFADEAGSWQVGVDWSKVLPSWFRVLSATAGAEEYAERITVLLEHHCNSERQKMLSVARRKGTPQQRKAERNFTDHATRDQVQKAVNEYLSCFMTEESASRILISRASQGHPI
jgi:endo-1,4-beta-D-glucanase Y